MSEEKKTTRTRKTVNVEDSNKDTELQKKLEEEKNKNNEMELMIKQLQAQMAMMQNQMMNQNQGGQVVIKQNDDMTRTVKVVSMISNRYDLPTQENGVGGKVYTFHGFGDVQNIRFSDMIDILSRFTHQFEKGYAILTNKKDYEDLGIGYIWETVPNFDKFEQIVNLDLEDSIDIILDMDASMQEKITETIAKKISEGRSYDYNKIKNLEDEGFRINEMVEMLNAEKMDVSK